MKSYFPAQGKGYVQVNRGDDTGSIWSSMGLDFQSNLATMRVAPRLKVGSSTADDAQLGLPIAFEYADNRLWAICGTAVFKNASTPNAVWTEDASVGAVLTYDLTSDLETFDGRLWSTSADKLFSKVLDGAGTGAWTSRDNLGTSPHGLKYFAKFNRLYYIFSANLVASINAANTASNAGGPYSIDLGVGNSVTTLEATTTQIWMGVSAISSASGLTASIFSWDGISAQATAKYLLKSRRVVAMTVMDDVPYAMDGNGVLNKFTGSSFEEVGRLPFTPILPTSTFVVPNGMIPTKNGTILVVVNNLNGDNAGSIYENIPSGVWEWSQEFGFTHKYAFTYTPSASSTITDYGQNRISAAGAIYGVDAVAQSTASRNGTILVGSTYYTDASTTTNAIFFNDSNNTLQKKGYFVTSWFDSQEVQDKWTRLWSTFRRFLGETDSIVFKYRIYEEDPTYADITWTSTTTFTTTTDVSAYGPTATGFNGTQGGEVEVIQGTGSASCAHITSITGAGTYTVTLDTAITGVTGTAKARFQKWIKLNPSVEPAQIRSFMQAGMGQESSARVQIKGCLTFTGDDEFFKFVMYSNPDITINQ